MNTNRKNAKHNSSAGSPLLTMGQKLVGMCWVKYANANTPELMNAAMRVKRPMVISTPVTSSRLPAHQYGQDAIGAACPVGHPNR
jgi:hypothetical protein